eukprot:4293737-Pyramimonas_sp.AAC.1
MLGHPRGPRRPAAAAASPAPLGRRLEPLRLTLQHLPPSRVDGEHASCRLAAAGAPVAAARP